MAVGQGYQGNLDAIVEALSPQSGTGDFIDDFRGKLLDDSSQAWHDFQKSNGGTALMSHNTGVPRPGLADLFHRFKLSLDGPAHLWRWRRRPY